jgi:hypothetical protein
MARRRLQIQERLDDDGNKMQAEAMAARRQQRRDADDWGSMTMVARGG